MHTFLKILSGAGLALTAMPSVLVFEGVLAWNVHALLMLIGVPLWFVPAWIEMNRSVSSSGGDR